MKRLDPPPGTSILDVLRFRAVTSPDALAYSCAAEQLTYRQLESDVLRLASGLSDAGLASGGRCAIVLPTGLDCVRAVFAVQLTGAVPVLLSSGRPARLTAQRLIRLGCGHALVEEPLQSQLEEVKPKSSRLPRLLTFSGLRQSGRPYPMWPRTTAGPSDPAFLQLTSGTTGEPRSVVVLHRNLMAALRADLSMFDAHDEDVLVGWVPLFHDLGLVRFVFGPMHLGRPVHLIEPLMSNLKVWLETAAAVGGTITAGPDFSFRIATRLFDGHTPDLGRLRFATNGGEPVRLKTIEDFEARFGVPGVVRPGYGLAEATLGVSSLRTGEAIRINATGAVSCGRARDGVHIRIVDPEGARLPPSVPGEIWIGGAQVCAGYLDDEPATRELLHDGWLRTGDVGEMDADGHLYVLGRRRAMIKRGGSLVVPRELEEAADQVSGVRFSAAIGQKSEESDGVEDIIIVAEFHPDDAPDADGQAALRATIARQVVKLVGLAPSQILLVPPRSIPRTYNGKIRYDELRRQVTEGQLQS